MAKPAGVSGPELKHRPGIVIAIDGPAGSGKSTLAALLAKKYNYINIETGAMYRALALKAVRKNISLEEEQGLATLAKASNLELWRASKAIGCCSMAKTLPCPSASKRSRMRPPGFQCIL